MNIDEPALVVFSGGQDSTTCLFWAKAIFAKVYAICFSYGQRHHLETDIARKIAADAEIDFRLIEVPFLHELNRNSLTDNSITVDTEIPENKLPNSFVPGRNLFFPSIAAAYAHELGIKHIITGVSQTDFSGYPDCRENFIKSLNKTLNLAMDEDFVIYTPLMHRDKCQIWALADDLGIFDLVRNNTLTCYNGIVGDGCGKCPACKLRKHGLELYLAQKKEPLIF